MPSLQQTTSDIIKNLKANKHLIEQNAKLFDIFEGELLPYVEEALRCQLSPQSFNQAKHRIAPINVLKRIIDKLSKIYQQNPTREVVDGTDQDAELLHWYEEKLSIDEKLNQSNEFLNLQKNNLVEIFIDKGEPKVRVYSAHQFWAYSDNKVDPTDPTHIVLFDQDDDSDSDQRRDLRIYSDDEFVIVDTDGNRLQHQMNDVGNPEGINPFGVLPFTYINSSANLLIPKPDTDTLAMSVLIPILFTDLNHAVQFQSFSMLYGIDVDIKNIERTPNAFLDLKSDMDTETTPQIGSIKPEVDIDQVLGLIASEFSLWLNTRGIKPGSIGTLSGDNFASGISKIIDEMDVSENRQSQVTIYNNAESDFWDLLLHKIHPFWVANGMIENRALFSQNAKVVTNFKPQVPMMQRVDIVKSLKEELSGGFTTKRRAIKELNPRMSEREIDELLADIDAENQITVDVAPIPALPIVETEDDKETEAMN